MIFKLLSSLNNNSMLQNQNLTTSANQNPYQPSRPYQPTRPYLTFQPYSPSNQEHISVDDAMLQRKSDAEYFRSLKHFKTLLYSGEGTPFFLYNDHWKGTLGSVVFLNLILVGSLVFFVLSGKDHKSEIHKQYYRVNSDATSSSNDVVVIVLSSIACILLINISYFFCQFMNPGVRNLTAIPQEQFLTDGKKFCHQCNFYRTLQMSHCKQCKVCVWGLDHHCGFFDKCIAGWQKWAFYALLTAVFGGFLLIIICLGLTLTLY